MGTTYELHNTSRQGSAMVPQGEMRPARPYRNGGSTSARVLSPELAAQIRAYCEQLKARFGDELRDRILVMKASQMFVGALLPRRGARGRPRSAIITRALELFNQGIPWPQIPWTVIPGFEKMSPAEQSFEREHLRRGMHMRRRRSGVTRGDVTNCKDVL